ncbi:putative DNA gyrase subunit A [Streptomyces misionensis JCM 4497]
MRPCRRRGHGQAAPARRRVDLRRPGAHGPALLHARAAGRRPRQLRFAGQRRPAGRHAVHRVPDGRGDEPDDRVDRRGHGRLRTELRRPGAGAGGAARRLPEPAGQRLLGHRGRHGHEHAAAQPARGRRRRPPSDQAPERGPGRADEARPGPRSAHRRPDRRPGRHPGRVRDRPRHVQDARDGLGRARDRPPQGPGDHRTAVRGRPGEGHREDQGPGQRQEGPGHRGRQGPHRPRARTAPGHRDQERLRARGHPGAALQADADGGVLRHQQRGPGGRPAAHPRPEGAAGGLPRPPLRRGAPPQRVPARQEERPAAPGRGSAHRAGRHRRGHPADPVQRQLRAGQGAPDGALLAERGADAVHPRHAAAPAHQVRPHRAGGGEGQAHRGDRGADPDPGVRRGAAQAGLGRTGRRRQEVRHRPAHGPAGVGRRPRRGRAAPGGRRPVPGAAVLHGPAGAYRDGRAVPGAGGRQAGQARCDRLGGAGDRARGDRRGDVGGPAAADQRGRSAAAAGHRGRAEPLRGRAAGGVRLPGGRRDGGVPDHAGRVVPGPRARHRAGCGQACGARLPVQQGGVGGHHAEGGRPDRRRGGAAHRRGGPGLHHGRRAVAAFPGLHRASAGPPGGRYGGHQARRGRAGHLVHGRRSGRRRGGVHRGGLARHAGRLGADDGQADPVRPVPAQGPGDRRSALPAVPEGRGLPRAGLGGPGARPRGAEERQPRGTAGAGPAPGRLGHLAAQDGLGGRGSGVLTAAGRVLGSFVWIRPDQRARLDPNERP